MTYNGVQGVWLTKEQLKQINHLILDAQECKEYSDSIAVEYEILGDMFDRRGIIIQEQQLQIQDMSKLHKEQMRKTKLIATGSTVVAVGLLIKVIFF